MSTATVSSTNASPATTLFAAAVGGIGAIGIITEVTVQAADRFNVEQKVALAELPDVESASKDSCSRTPT